MAERARNDTIASSRSTTATDSFARRWAGFSLRGETGFRAEKKTTYSLFCLSTNNPIRKYSSRLVNSKPFDYFILLTIAANCVVLSMDAPHPAGDSTDLNRQLEASEIYFVAIYSFEALMKILAMGFILHPGAYLRNGWNILDFIVLIVGIIGVVPEMSQETKDNSEGIKALRAIRVLRPLKLVSGIPSLQVVMKSIVRAMKPLMQILFLITFIIVIYAIIGLELLVGRFHWTCRNIETDQISDTLLPIRPCGDEGGRTCGSGERCEYINSWAEWPGPHYGITSYDHIFLAMLTVFQCVTMEGWTDIMYISFDAREYKYGIVTSLLYISLVIIGSFFMLNLILGVLSGEFAKERERVENRRSFFKIRRQQQLERIMAGYTDWIIKAEEIIIREEQNEDERQAQAARRIQENMLHKRHSLSESFMNLIDGNKDLLNHLNNCRKDAQSSISNKTEALRKLKQKVKKMRVYVRQIVRSTFFYWSVIVCVFLNTLVIALEHHGQPDFLTKFQDTCELVFLVIFIAEMLFKMFGLGFHTYFASAFNCFDFTVVLCGLVEMIIQEVQGVSLGISVLRSLRLLRIFKVTRFWKSLRNLVTSLLNSVRSILSLIFLLLLFIFIFALLGMQLFGAKFNNKLDPPRTNFDNFFQAMLAVFQMLSGEDWNTVMYEGILASGGPHTITGNLASLYFIGLVILGNYTLLNVFLAIAVDNLATAQALTRDEEREQKERELAKKRIQEKRQKGWLKAKKQLPIVLTFKHLSNLRNNRLAEQKRSGSERISFEDSAPATSPEDVTIQFDSTPDTNIRAGIYEVTEDQNKTAENDRGEEVVGKISFAEILQQVKDRDAQERQFGMDEDAEGIKSEDNYIEEGINHHGFARSLRNPEKIIGRRLITRRVPIIRKNSLFIFSPENPIRQFCHWVVNLRYFDDAILVMIAISSLSLAIEDPVEAFGQSERNKILSYFDWIFTVVFAIEVIIKIIDVGAVLHKGSYFRDPWNVIDAVVVCANVATLAIRTSSSEIGLSGKDILKCLRVLRVLRPLKAINKSRKLKTVFQCMVYSLKNVINIILITLLFLFIFAVIGVQLFQGKLFHCTDPSKRTEETCKGQFFHYYRAAQHEDITSYKVTDREWKKRVFNFDSLPHAMLTLFSSLTGEGWPTTMYQTVDATEVNMGPIRDYKIYMSIYYVCFVVVFAFFFINIFVALIIVTFQESGERNILACDLDRNQRDCIQFAINAKPRQRFMPEDKSTISYKMWVLVESKPFELSIMVLIALNAIVLMMSYDGMSKMYENTLIYMNAGFTIIFTIEAILKLVAFRTNYFRDGWNVFDFIIVLITFSGVILNLARGTQDIPIDPTFFRLFRAARLIKLIRQGYTIRMLLWTFLQSLKALPYVVTLMAILFFIYAVVGMQLFGRIQLNDATNIKHHNNFQSFPRALQVLFRAATGESWHLVMKDCFDQALCDSRAGLGPGAKCGNTAASIIYFCSFYFLCSFLMLNLFVAVILDNFEYLTRDESILGPHHLDEFVRVWSEYDPTATGRITHKNVYRLMCDMSPPVGFGRKCPRFLAYKRLIKMNMPIMGDSTVLFTSTLVALIRTALGIYNNGEPSKGDDELRQVIKRLWPKVSQKILNRMVPRDSVLSSHQLTIGKVYCAKLIYENYKNRKRKQKEMEFRGKKKRQPSLFRRLMGALRTAGSGLEDEETGNDNNLRPPPAAHLNRRRRSQTLNTPPLALRDKPNDSVKMSKTKSMKFFRKSHKKRNAANRSTMSGRIVTFSEDIPMDITDIKPTLIDCEENQDILPKPRSFTFDNPAMSIDDEKFIPRLVKKSASLHGAWPPLTPALLILQVPTLEHTATPSTPPALDPSFPDVIRSAEASPRPSLTSVIPDASLIKEINERIAEAVKRGQSPYSIYAIKDGDEASWC